MAAPDYLGLIKALRVNGEDVPVAAIRFVEDETGGTVFLRAGLTAATPADGVELIDAEGRVLLRAPDVTGDVAAGGEVAIRYGAPLESTAQAIEVPTPEPAPTEATTPPSGKAGTKGE